MSYKSDITDANAQYLSGKYREAFSIYEKWASDGCSDCRRMLGWMYFDGFAVEQDLDKAIDCFKLSADEGDLEAFFGVAKCYIKSNDYHQAFSQLEELNKSDYPPAQYWLGWIYENGLYPKRNIHLALVYYQKAALSGHVYASQREFRLLLRGEKGIYGRTLACLKFVKLLRLGFELALANERQDPRFLK